MSKTINATRMPDGEWGDASDDSDPATLFDEPDLSDDGQDE